MTQPSAYEQYLLELINAERAAAGVQPLAFDGDLNEAADGHSQWMLAADTFSHTGAGGSNAGARMGNAGYMFSGSWAWGENIARATTRSPAGYQDEVLLLHTNLMNSSGHRANILNANYREVGLGFEIGDYQGRDNAMLTEDFAKSGTDKFLTGVAFDDLDGDRFYDVGEGLSGVTLTAVGSAGQTYTTTTMSAGGYDLVLPSGTYTVTFSGPGIASTTSQVTVGSINVKLDLIDPAAGSQPPPPPPPPGPIVGTGQGETLNGSANADTIQGLGGNDTLNGGAGNDSLDGGSGNDILDGGLGADRMAGGSGNDTYVVDQGGDVITESSGAGTDTVQASLTWTLGANLENLTLTGGSAINGTGNGGGNVMTGNAAGNTLSGLSGNDTVNGGGAADTLLGGSGNDTMNGGDANDLLNGGTGRDTMTGASGADRFVFASTSESTSSNRDVITDFLHGSDLIDLSAIDARAYSSGNQAFGYAGQAAAAAAYSVSWFESGGNTIVQADVTGNSTADFSILLSGINLGLTQSDFLL